MINHGCSCGFSVASGYCNYFTISFIPVGKFYFTYNFNSTLPQFSYHFILFRYSRALHNNEAFNIFSLECFPSSKSIALAANSFFKAGFIIPASLTKTFHPSFLASKAAPMPLSPAPSITILFILAFFNWFETIKKWFFNGMRFNGSEKFITGIGMVKAFLILKKIVFIKTNFSDSCRFLLFLINHLQSFILKF